MTPRTAGCISILLICSVIPIAAADPQAFRAGGEAVIPTPQGLYICEAEEFKVQSPGWQAKRWGENYYAATFANSFLSRKAFLGAPEQCDDSVATINVDVKDAGRYLVLVRYEAAYRFETQFNVKVEQSNNTLLDRLYGARDNVKIWAFREGLKKEVAWPWGAVENVVWEGHDAFVDLQPGIAKISLTASRQSGNAARRNVDLVLLTRDEQDVQHRIEKESYLPLDGLLTQAGDVWARVTNTGAAPITITIGGWQEHSPYWVHIRDPKVWAQVPIAVEPGKTSQWTDVGGPMDALNDGNIHASAGESGGTFKLEIAIKTAAGTLEPIAQFDVNKQIKLAAWADTRYSRKIATIDQPLYDLLAYLEKIPQHGKTPQRTLIYGYTFSPIEGNARFNEAIKRFAALYALGDVTSKTSTYIDLRDVPTDKLAEHCQKLGSDAKQIEVVSLGDEIGLPSPDPAAAGEGFRQFLQEQNLKPAEIDPAAGDDWTKINYNPDPKLKDSSPGLYYWSKRYLYRYGIDAIKQRTDILRANLPKARIGANYSPHHGGAAHSYLGQVFQWVTCFRRDGMILPWSEDYIWQVPVGSPQMNGMNLDLFRAGTRGKPDRDILYYVMPHAPGNTPRMWRRLYHNALAHGMTVVNLFEFRPVWNAYTENHVTNDEMYGTVLTTFRELGLYEDIVQDGQVRPSDVGMWFSETADIWGDNAGSFAAAKRGLYVAILQNQTTVDVVVEEDSLDQYKVLYLTDNHVSQAASRKIAQWVSGGGRLFATAGAGMFDELNRPNVIMRELLGVDQKSLEAPEAARVAFIKQDLPFAPSLGTLKLIEGGSFDIFGAVSRITVGGAETRGTFADGSPALTVRKVGAGEAMYCAFLPSLSFFKPAIPLRPVDRGSTDDAMAHFMPTDFDPVAGKLIDLPLGTIVKPITCDQPNVAASIIPSPHGTMIVLENWSPAPKTSLQVTVNTPLPGGSVTLASGKKVTANKQGEKTILVLDLDVADVIIAR